MSNNEKTKGKDFWKKVELFCALLKQEYPDSVIIYYKIPLDGYDSHAILKHKKENLVTEVTAYFSGESTLNSKLLSITKRNTRDLRIYGNKFGHVFDSATRQIRPHLFYYVDTIMYLRDGCVDFFAKLSEGPTECYHVKFSGKHEYMEFYLPNEETVDDYLEELSDCYEEVTQIEEGVYKAYDRPKESEARVYVEKVTL